MDRRLALLLHLFHGLKLSSADLEGLWSLGAEQIFDAELVLQKLVSLEAQSYVSCCSDWQDQSWRVFETSLEKGVRWSYPGQQDYPDGWNSLSRRPLLFSYRGQPLWQQWPLLSIVGSRTPMSDTSIWLQRELASCLKQHSIGVVSGGARGVDQWAHRLALASGRPTVCVFPSGLCNPYPTANQELWEAILMADGCLLSTFALHEPMRKSSFAIRNRWITGLSPLTFVAEANRRSGSHLTAGLALEEGREVAVLPVSAYSGQGLANLDLLMDGAHLVRHAGDLGVLIERYVRPLFLSPSFA